MQSIIIKKCKTVAEAPNYSKDLPEFKSAELKKAIIVENGMESGEATVDLQFEDQDGNKYTAMITGTLLKAVTRCIGDKDNE